MPFEGVSNGEGITGRLGGEKAVGDATLRLSSAGASGEFTFGDQKGSLALEHTSLTAASLLRPLQTLDLTPGQWNEDLDALVQILSTKHGDPFHHTPRARFLHEVEQKKAAAGDIDRDRELDSFSPPRGFDRRWA